MPAVTLLPVSRLSPMGEWTPTGAGSLAAALQSDDGGTSFVTKTSSFLPLGPLELVMEDVPLQASIVSLTARVSAMGTGAYTERVQVWARLAGVDGPMAINLKPATVYTTYSAALPHPFALPWSASDLANATVLLDATDTVDVSLLVWDAVYSIAATLTGIERAYLTARAGWMRASSARAGFIPTATQGTTAAAGLAPGTPGGYYSWRRRYLPETVWTPVRPLAVDR